MGILWDNFWKSLISRKEEPKKDEKKEPKEYVIIVDQKDSAVETDYPIITDIAEFGRASFRLHEIQSEINNQRLNQESARENEEQYTHELKEYESEIARRKNDSLTKKIMELTHTENVNIELPSKPIRYPSLYSLGDLTVPEHMIIKYEQIAKRMWDFSLEHSVKIEIYVIPEKRIAIEDDGDYKYKVQLDFKGFVLKFGPKHKEELWREESYRKYFHLMMLNEQDFNKKVKEKILDDYLDGWELREIKFEKEDELFTYIKKIKDQFEAKGSSNYDIIACQPRKRVDDRRSSSAED